MKSLFLSACLLILAAACKTPDYPEGAYCDNTGGVYSKGEIGWPTAFTPNGDGKNDRYAPVFTKTDITSYTMAIYSGVDPVYYTTELSNDPAKGWDGLMPGASQPVPGDYVVMIRMAEGTGTASNSCLHLKLALEKPGSGCIDLGGGKNYVFADQIDLVKGYGAHPTAEVICP